ncbi:MAG: hypothetical protein M0C28_04890 [Candidatus Moduliflexus flocculans]|nr:hypothetical protein [Candidatus Moduliflexus flocculans]
MAALSAARKVLDPFMTYQGGYGNEEPVYVWFEYGKSARGLRPGRGEVLEVPGRRGRGTSPKRTRAMIRKQETKDRALPARPVLRPAALTQTRGDRPRRPRPGPRTASISATSLGRSHAPRSGCALRSTRAVNAAA